jgi:N-acetylmuramoyl-L-alanine amidase
MAATAYLFNFTLREFVYTFAEFSGKSLKADSDIRPYPLIVIDPGHGGEDGGASVDGGIHEKDLNLLISQTLYDMLKLAGFNPAMTRTEDVLLYDMFSDSNDYTGKKKMFDLKNRLRFANVNDAAIFISVHMNKFPQSSARGLQMYYSPNNEDSKKLAEMIKGYTKQYIQPENTREIKKAGSNIYLLKRLEMPSVLIECGFLSNADECAQLTDAAYRKQLAAAIFAAVSEFIGYYANKG